MREHHFIERVIPLFLPKLTASLKNRRSIAIKLLLLFSCSVIMIGILLGVISYRIASSALIQQAENGSEQSVTLAGEMLDMKGQFLVDLSNQLSNNSRFIDHLFQITIPELKEDERQRRMAEMKTMLGQLALSDSVIADITLIPLEDDIDVISTNQEVNAADLNASWIQGVKDQGGKPYWLPLQQQGYLGQYSKPLIAYGKLLGKSNIGSHDFILLVQLDASFIAHMIEDVKLSESGITTVIDESGNILGDNRIQQESTAIVLPPVELLSSEMTSASYRSGDSLVVYRSSPLNGWTIIGTAPIAELTYAADKIKWVTIWIIVGSIVLSLASGLLLAWRIATPLKSLEKLMSLAAVGDFRSRMKEDSNDEIGRVAEGYNIMIEQISRLIVNARNSVKQLSVASDQISSAAEHTDQSSQETKQASVQIARGATELAVSADQGNSYVLDMEAAITQVANLQQQMSQSAQLSYESGGAGYAAAEQLLLRCQESEQQLITVNERMMSLSNAALSIEQLLQLMEQVFKRIKVLSLNATIEAIRAGAAGAGFKVIADEIRGLADQSNQSINKAGEMTTSVMQQVRSVREAVQQTFPAYRAMFAEVHTVHHAIGEMSDRSESVVRSCEEINAALGQLQQTQMLLSSAMGEVAAFSQQSSATTEQVAALCNQQALIGNQLLELSATLTNISEQLEQQMDGFKLE